MACRSFSLRSKKQSVASLRWMEMTSLDEVAIGCIELASKRICQARAHIARDKPKWRPVTAFPVRQE